MSQLGCLMALRTRLLLHQLLHVYYYCHCIMLHIPTVQEMTSANWIFCNSGCRMDSLRASGYCRYGLPKGGYCKGELPFLVSMFFSEFLISFIFCWSEWRFISAIIFLFNILTCLNFPLYASCLTYIVKNGTYVLYM